MMQEDARFGGESTASYVLRDVSVLDETGTFSEPLDIRIAHGAVAELGENIHSSDPSLDFAGLWLMPGVFDCHDHVTMSSLSALECLETPVSQWALEAAQNARKTLEAGVTFVRDAGGADMGLRESIERGYAPGPRLQISVTVLSQTGGHMDGFLRGAGFEMPAEYLIPDYPGRPPVIVDGAAEMQHAVRAVLRAGADWIKLCTTGGIMSAHDEPLGAEFTLEEIGVSVFEAARKGKSVMAHAYGGEGLDNAVRGGVRTIEHGTWLTEQQAAEMASKGCWLVPTLAILRDLVRWSDEGLLPAYTSAKAAELRTVIGQAVGIARAAGVRIALGTDFVMRDEHGTNLDEIALLCEAGMPLQDVLLAATSGGAEMCGVADRYGRIAPGYIFDAIVFDEEPTTPSVFSTRGAVKEVFRSGVPVIGNPKIPLAVTA
jgi:imidazolonepropionase-like amidohydrolase